ncbi:MAG TPA: hypothetical protein PLW67_02085 [Prolixibacteraceae bacterium]|nr:hypothetical protein [Prolixibacteraceae bacterium]
MKTLGKYKIVLLIAGIFLVLMIIRTAGTCSWKGKAGQTGEAIAAGTCYVDLNKLKSPGESSHLLRIGNSGPDSLLKLLNLPETRLAFADLKPGKKLKELKSLGSRMVIVGTSREEGIKAWVILHQLGVKNLFILSLPDGYDEVLKYRFRPDSTFRPEPEAGEN